MRPGSALAANLSTSVRSGPLQHPLHVRPSSIRFWDPHAPCVKDKSDWASVWIFEIWSVLCQKAARKQELRQFWPPPSEVGLLTQRPLRDLTLFLLSAHDVFGHQLSAVKFVIYGLRSKEYCEPGLLRAAAGSV